MDLESVIQSEVSQKDKNTYIWNLKRNGPDESRDRTVIKTQT